MSTISAQVARLSPEEKAKVLKQARKITKTIKRGKGWPKAATHIYNAECGCRMFSNKEDVGIHESRMFYVHCCDEGATKRKKKSYTKIV
jgi:hypothetical protein